MNDPGEAQEAKGQVRVEYIRSRLRRVRVQTYFICAERPAAPGQWAPTASPFEHYGIAIAFTV